MKTKQNIFLNEDDLKNEHHLKIEDDLKNEDDFKYENDIKNEEDLKIFYFPN